jgi:hypothetical protein
MRLGARLPPGVRRQTSRVVAVMMPFQPFSGRPRLAHLGGACLFPGRANLSQIQLEARDCIGRGRD